ncbi:MAG: PfkB family carbohydrate kinase, partial [Anaerolineae bacterium]|nr:PfkB family carbohydrate kinase [Thermoflexales bacterium]MDW8407967.1 PfkB family carbohydrate kinase [Anaerolineae bacterium]
VFVGVTPQGWLRRWNEAGEVYAGDWEHAELILPRANATVLSIDDIAGDWQRAQAWAARTSVLVVTQAAAGCTVFFEGQAVHVPAPEVTQIEPTGAGDIFAAALFIALERGCTPVRACEIANCVAAHSVTFPHGQGFPTRQDAQRCAGALV